MFDNVGGKIKALAAVLGWIDFIAGFIIAFAFWAGEKGFWTGMIPLLTGLRRRGRCTASVSS